MYNDHTSLISTQSVQTKVIIVIFPSPSWYYRHYYYIRWSLDRPYVVIRTHLFWFANAIHNFKWVRMPGDNLSGVADQFATQFWAYTTQYNVFVAAFGKEKSSFAHIFYTSTQFIWDKLLVPEWWNGKRQWICSRLSSVNANTPSPPCSKLSEMSSVCGMSRMTRNLALLPYYCHSSK